MIVNNPEAAKKAVQVVNALIRLQKNTSDITTIIDDLHQAYSYEELQSMKYSLDTYKKQNKNEKNSNTSFTGIIEDTAIA